MFNPHDMEADWVFAKTPTGAEEIQQRTLRLGLLQRRVLLLVDGRRTLAEVSKLAGNADAAALLSELVSLGCVVHAQPPPVTPRAVLAASAAQGPGPLLPPLPPPETRSADEVQMAQHFMVNTINRMLEQNSRLSLVGKIVGSADAAELRQHYPAWEEAIASSWMGRRRLGELRAKLFAVL